MKNQQTVYATGKLYWAKIVGQDALVDNYEKTGREWTFEFQPDDTSFLKEARLLDRLKDPLAYAGRLEQRGEVEKAQKAREMAEGRTDYLLIKKAELNKEGKANKPFKIIDSDNKEWDDRKIGNGSTADVKLSIIDWGPGKKKSIWCSAIRVQDLIPYEDDGGGIFGGMDGNSPKPSSAPVLEDDDDLPF